MTALPPLIGLIGKKRVGKDTFAAVLVEEFNFIRVAFADPLKSLALTIDPLIVAGSDWAGERHLTQYVDRFGWESVKDNWPESRRFLQRLGDGVRQFDPAFWVNAGMDTAADWRDGYGGDGEWSPMPVVITDVRYPNEADAIRDAGGTLVRIVRPGVDDGDTHASETALDGYRADWAVLNEGSVTDLQKTARRMAKYNF